MNPSVSWPRLARSILAAAAIAVATVLPARAFEIEEVTAPGTGVTAFLVEDRTNPIITLRIAFKGGALIEREGEEGLVNLLSGMLDEGAGELTSEEFQRRLDERGIRFSASSGREGFRVGVTALEDRFDEAVELLASALAEPRFDAEPLARMKRQIAGSLRASRATPRAEASREVRELIWGEHPYARSASGEPEIIEAATPEALRGVSRRLFTRDNAVVGAVGAIDAGGLADALDTVFADLPEAGERLDLPAAEPTLGVERDIALPGGQVSIQVVLPAPLREEDDFFAAYLVNHVLGGGTFTSRLYNELREKRGLTYGASSGIATLDRGATWTAGVQTRPENAGEARRILLGEIERMAKDGPTEAELEAAKAYVKGSYAINNFGSSSAVAGVLLGLQESDLGIDYIDRRGALIDAVTIEDARAAAARYLGAEPTVIVTRPSA